MTEASDRSVASGPGVGSAPRKATPLAALLAWVLPGLGYVSHGQVGRGAAVGGSILGLIVLGLLLGGPDAIDSREERWWFFVQAGGGPVVLALDQWHQKVLKVPAQDGRGYPVTPDPDPALNPGNREAGFTRSVARVNESARLFIVVAGMLNLIAIIDCWSLAARPGGRAGRGGRRGPGGEGSGR